MKDMVAWRDHPNVDIIDNSSKISQLNDLVVKRIGIDVGNRWTQEIFLNQTIGKFHVCVFFRFQPNSEKGAKFSKSHVCCVWNVSRFRLPGQIYRLPGLS